MNFSSLLLEFLTKNGVVTLPGFGEFYLKKTSASLNKEGKNILPPGKEIAFRTDLQNNGQDFINFLSQKNEVSNAEAEIEIKKQLNFWNSTLEKEHHFNLDRVGTFYLSADTISFKGLRTENLSPDFYGLEEINISAIGKGKSKLKDLDSEKSYSFGKSLYWVIPLAIGIGALIYFAVTQPELLFGRKSFKNDLKEETSKKPQTSVLKNDSLKVDSAALKMTADSLRTDSLQRVNNIKNAPAKKWSSKNYSNSKWKKVKRRKNR